MGRLSVEPVEASTSLTPGRSSRERPCVMLGNGSIQEAACPSQKGVAVRVPFLERGAALGERTYFVYIMASRRNGTLYISVTNNLALRAHQHRTGVGSAFTTKYGVKMLVWYEQYDEVNEAIAREKRLKTWQRKWKLGLIEHFNRDWCDLYEQLNA
jgi:putative endonuclease